MTQASKRNHGHAKRGAKAINESLNKRLAVYALAAGAAGVSVLALAPAAHADIIMGTGTPITVGANQIEYLMINGKNVIKFSDVVVSNSPGHLSAHGSGGAEIEIGPLAKSAVIGTGGAFVGGAKLAGNVFRATGSGAIATTNGPWANKTGYLGLKFESNGKSYFGWAHLKVTANAAAGETGFISSFAYDDVAGQSILTGQKPTVTPEPGTLTLYLLALGALGLVELRRRKQLAVSQQPSASN